MPPKRPVPQRTTYTPCAPATAATSARVTTSAELCLFAAPSAPRVSAPFGPCFPHSMLAAAPHRIERGKQGRAETFQGLAELGGAVGYVRFGAARWSPWR